VTKKKRFMALPSSACIIKPFKTVINAIQYKARVFDYYSHFYASLIELITVTKSFIIGHWSKLNRFDYFILVYNVGTTQHDDIQHNDIQHNDTKHNDTEY